MHFCVISSGSRANCTYIESSNTKILIDCGLSGRQFEERMHKAHLNPAKLDAILVTHEHSDHIHGVPVLSKRYKIPVFTTSLTSKQIPKCFHIEKIKRGDEFWIGDIRIRSFPVVHDAVDPVGYVLETEGVKFAQATDLGRVTSIVKESLKGANALVLESNHDVDKLWSCDYTWELKQRIASANGHLSNDTAASLLLELVHPSLCHVVLGHLSENSNSPDLALKTHKAMLGALSGFSLSCGSARDVSRVFEVGWESGYELSMSSN